MDLSKLSDEELFKLAQGTQSKVDSTPAYDFSKMSDDELRSLAFKDLETPKEEPKESFGKGLLRGTLESLPTAGALFGGTAGLTAGPLGAIGGAGLGAAAGESIKNIGKKYLLDEAPTRTELYSGPAIQALQGAAGEGTGQIIGKLGQMGAKGLSEFLFTKQKPNVAEIAKATEAIGAKITPGQKTLDPYVQNLQSSLEQSPSIAGYLMRKETQPLREAVKETAKGAFENVPSKAASEVGSQVKSQIINQIEGRVSKAGEVYDRVRASTQFIDVNPQSLNKVSKNISELTKFKNAPEYPILQGLAEDLKTVQNVDQLKQFRSLVGKSLNRFNAGTPEYAALSEVYGKIANLEKNTIMREAIKQARVGGMQTKTGEKIGTNIVNELKGANKEYAEIFKDLGFLGGQTGAAKGKVKSIDYVLNKLDQIPDEIIGEKLMKTTDRKALERLKSMFPDQFENLRLQKLDFIREKSSIRGDIDPVKLLTNIKSMEPQTQVLLFGNKSKEMIDNLKTVVNSLPQKVGASDTPRGIDWMNFLNPTTYPGELARLGQLGLIKIKSSGIKAPQINLTRPTQSIIGQTINGPSKDNSITRRINQLQQGGQ